MARARNIKPGFYKNPELVECSVWARLIFPGLWMLADREGRLEDRPKQIKMELLPADNQEVDPLLAELEANGFIERYRNEDGSFIQIVKFLEHQSPHFSEKPSIIKPPDSRKVAALSSPDSENEQVLKGSENARTPKAQPPESLNPSSLNPSSLNPEEESSSAPLCVAPPTPPPDFDGENSKTLNGKAIVRLSAAFELPEEWGIAAEALGWKTGDVLREGEKFKQYWTAGKGAGKRRNVKGWRQSWSNWLAKAAEHVK